MNCVGHLFPDQPEVALRKRAPPIDAVRAVQHSCNVYFYRLGSNSAFPVEANWMRQFGMGHALGHGPDRRVPRALAGGY